MITEPLRGQEREVPDPALRVEIALTDLRHDFEVDAKGWNLIHALEFQLRSGQDHRPTRPRKRLINRAVVRSGTPQRYAAELTRCERRIAELELTEGPVSLLAQPERAHSGIDFSPVADGLQAMIHHGPAAKRDSAVAC